MPKLRSAVKDGTYTWQQLFNIWRDRGEEDSFWDKYREEQNTSESKGSTKINETIQKFADTFSRIDVDEVNKHVSSLSETIDELKKMFGNQSNPPPQQEQNYPPPDPFRRRYY